MLTRPLYVAGALARSGIPHLLEPLLLLPLAGPEGLVAALPALVPYAAADYRPLHDFSLYYSMPVLAFLFVGATYGIARLAASAPRRRLAALAVLAVCALDGAGYTFPRANRLGGRIAPALASLGARPVRIQGSLYPRAGYSANRRALDRVRPLAPDEAVLLAPTTNPWPFNRNELDALVVKLSADPHYVRTGDPRGLVLFVPRD
jgi:hypothetical protein